jgi:leader peptidase (prepilin peptidase) / N-methyltransferase
MITVVLVLLGLVLGSFINALVWRLHEGKDWVRGRSECPHCHHLLAAKDLVPVLSWLALRGKCRYCHQTIDDNPLVELAVPLLFVASYHWWPLQFSGSGLFMFIVWLLFLVGFVALATYDLRWFLLPNRIVFPLVGLAILQLASLVVFYDAGWRDVLDPSLGALTIAGLFYVLFQLSKGTWIGGGDVKLGMVLGLLAGDILRSLAVLFIASLIGTFYALPLLLTGKARRGTHLPFGPFLILGLIVVKLFGTHLLNWYIGLFTA